MILTAILVTGCYLAFVATAMWWLARTADTLDWPDDE